MRNTPEVVTVVFSVLQDKAQQCVFTSTNQPTNQPWAAQRRHAAHISKVPHRFDPFLTFRACYFQK